MSEQHVLSDVYAGNPTAAPSQEVVRVMLLPAEGRNILVPATSVAEIVSADAVQQTVNGPDWYFGDFQWRGRWAPAVTFAPLPPMMSTRTRAHARLIICFAPMTNAELPYVAFYSLGMPRLERATPDSLVSLSDTHPFALSAIMINGHEAWIPDFSALEKAVHQLPRRS